MICIVDYGLGNIRSVQKALCRIGIDSFVSSNYKDFNLASHFLLPGVGHFKKGMDNLRSKDLISPLNEFVLEKRKPVLGICLGMQLMTQFSEEGDVEGLGWIPSKTLAFKGRIEGLKIPHMGWNSLNITSQGSWLPCEDNILQYYFVHSYFISCENIDHISATTKYGVELVSSFHFENIYGTQFHPEKSHDQGLALLKNFYTKAVCSDHE
ncbi:imidazole glycerol phosphate synthase subunit HisH [Algoriphagus taiwanensis]|uniref:Imidazole glycerol phosphate synthase subunit HisH n=1 Tax=Algoriphagus taiwanensis TaxID=1445656 RepID=A0ABQ6Q3Q3_9BACT|nr:imidazole glycerol phosphate synthase subunit HisH [Algoriphagus taiwanensis]